MTKPKTAGKHPAVLYINGVGCFSQESIDLSSPDAKLLYGLTRAGFVTMRVEKSGMSDSQGPPCASPEVDLEAEMRGYLAGLKALKAYPVVDSNAVFLVGLSIGGVEAPLVAQQIPVRGLVVINTVAKPFLEYLTDTRRRQHLLRHTAYDEMEQRLRLNEQCNHRLLIERETPEQVIKEIPGCGDYITYPAPYTFMQQWAALNPAQEWKKVNVPVLVVYGTSDFISTIGGAGGVCPGGARSHQELASTTGQYVGKGPWARCWAVDAFSEIASRSPRSRGWRASASKTIAIRESPGCFKSILIAKPKSWIISAH